MKIPDKLPKSVAMQPALSVVDSSKMQQYMDCPREFFFRYVLNWDTQTKSHHLVFGEAIHRGLEHLLLNGYNLDSVETAYQIGKEYYREELPDSLNDQGRYPKIPEAIPQLLADYIRQYPDDLSRFEVLYTEVAGSVPIAENRSIHYRLDAIVKDRETNRIWALEHKTAGRFGRTWVDQWYMKMQVFVYTHVLYSLFDPEEVEGVMINGLCLAKATKADLAKDRLVKTEFMRVPICKPVDLMDDWLWHINDWYSKIEDDMHGLKCAREEDRVLKTFARNTESCTKYFGCPYLDYCSAWSNPLGKQMPLEYNERIWNPSDREKDARTIMHLGDKK